MATRGTAMLITNEQVLFGPEFNGDMYPHGLGDKFMELVSQVNDNVEFIKMNNKFNKENHDYKQIMSRYQGKFSHDEIKVDGAFSMSKIYQKHYVTSDWIFVKNISNNTIKFEVEVNGEKQIIEIKSNETFRVHFGELYQ